MGPFAAALMLRFGIRRVLMTALALMAFATLGQRFHDRALGADPELGRAVGARQRMRCDDARRYRYQPLVRYE